MSAVRQFMVRLWNGIFGYDTRQLDAFSRELDRRWREQPELIEREYWDKL